MDLAKVFKCCDINVTFMDVKPNFTAHKRIIKELPELGDCYYKREVILEWRFPEIGCEQLTQKFLGRLGVYSQDGLKALNKVYDTISCVREKKDGTEVIVFQIVTISKVITFLWNHEDIFEIKENEPSHLEYVEREGIYYLLSGSIGDGLRDFPVQINEWHYFTHEFVGRCHEGIIVMLNGVEYKVPRELTVTLEAKNGSLVDANGKSYSVNKPRYGLWDYVLDERRRVVRAVRMRKDRLHPDGTRVIDMILRTGVTFKTLMVSVPVPKYGIAKFCQDRVRIIDFTQNDATEKIINCDIVPVPERKKANIGMSKNYHVNQFMVKEKKLPLNFRDIKVKDMIFICNNGYYIRKPRVEFDLFHKISGEKLRI